jgi:hypothetical protein
LEAKIANLNLNEPTTPDELKAAYEVVSEFPFKSVVGVSMLLVKGSKEGTSTTQDQEHKLFIQSALNTEVINEFFAITHSQGNHSKLSIGAGTRLGTCVVLGRGTITTVSRCAACHPMCRASSTTPTAMALIVLLLLLCL